MALVAASRGPSLLVSYLEACLSRLEHWLWDWRIAVNVSKSTAVLFVKAVRCIQKPRLVQFLGEPIQWVKTAQYLGATLDIQLTCSAHVNQVGRKAAQRLGVLGLLLNRRSSLSIRNDVLLYKKLIHPMMDYACPIWRSAACSHIWKLQVLQSKCLSIVTNAPRNRQIHEDLGILFFANHIRALSFVTNAPLNSLAQVPPFIGYRGSVLGGKYCRRFEAR
jgi:hypothetical protein